MRQFQSLHPVVLLLFFMAILIPVMVFMEPWMILIAVVTGFFCSILWKKNFQFQTVLFYILLVAVVTVINALVYRTGNHILFYILDLGISYEGIGYGLQTGGMLVAALLWCGSMSELITGDSVLVLLQRFPKTALLFTMILRLIPRYLRRYREVHAAEMANGGNETRARIGFVVRASAVFTWALENAVCTADSMELRGYGNRKRTRLKSAWYKRDTIVLIMILLAQAGYMLGSWLPILILGIMPILYLVKEEIRWTLYSKRNFKKEV